jgi:hypothetical protein
MVLHIFLRQINLGSSLMVTARSIILAIYVPAATVLDNGDSCSGLPSDVDQAVRLLFPGDEG